MNLKEYKQIVSKHSKKENILFNVLVSFISGGCIGLFGQVFIEFLINKFNMNISESYMYLMILLVVISSILTGTGYFDKVVSYFKCGLIVPTSGFAHTMTSSSMDHVSEGPIKGIGSNIFKMTGSVILYGIVTGTFLALLKGVIS